MVKNVIQIKSRITINISTSVKPKKTLCLKKKVMFGILLHVVLKMVNMWEVLLMIQL